jgi:hypothetical protein
MLIVLFLVSMGIFISGLLVYKLADYGDENPYSYIGIILGGLLSLGTFVALIVGGITISESRVIDAKIQMYTEENTNIETTITATVEKYLEHELNIFDSLQGEDIQTLLVMYPQINSNELVKAQIEVFIDNNNKIKELKEQKLNLEVWKFWVYFG